MSQRPEPESIDNLRPHKWGSCAHGTDYRYLSGCRCFPCLLAHRRKVRHQNQPPRKVSKNPMIDAGPVRAKMAELAAAGMGHKHAAAVAGVSHSNLWRVIHTPDRLIRKATAAKILALEIDLDLMARRALIDARPTWRLIWQMQDRGHTAVEIANRLGLSHHLQFGKRLITAENAVKVRELAAELLGLPDEEEVTP